MRQKHLFRLAYGVLALAFWLSVAGFAYVMTRPEDTAAPARWSAWKPAGQGLVGARSIALHVARQYKLEDGRQLVAIQEHPPVVQGVDLEAIGIRKTNPSGQLDPYIALYGGRRTLMYAFCGLGSNCAIPGTLDDARDRLLRREALEVALYSLKYIDGIDGVVTLLPPSDNTQTQGTHAVFFRKDALKRVLQRPLDDVLQVKPSLAPAQLPAGEATAIDQLTMDRTFPAAFEPLPDGDAILVLQYSSGSS